MSRGVDGRAAAVFAFRVDFFAACTGFFAVRARFAIFVAIFFIPPLWGMIGGWNDFVKKWRYVECST
jgi:hypothetical protein